jgi:hypothetical protein
MRLGMLRDISIICFATDLRLSPTHSHIYLQRKLCDAVSVDNESNELIRKPKRRRTKGIGRDGNSDDGMYDHDPFRGFSGIGDGDLFMGVSEQGFQNLEDDDYFVVNVGGQCDSFSDMKEYNGYDEYGGDNFLIDSPPEFFPEIENAIIPFCHGHAPSDTKSPSSPTSVVDHHMQSNGINVRKRKRRLMPHVDLDGIVDNSMMSMHSLVQQCSFGSRLAPTKLTAMPVLERQQRKHFAYISNCTEKGGFGLSQCLRAFSTSMVQVKKSSKGLKQKFGTGQREDVWMDFYDEDDRLVEIERLRTALNFTPQSKRLLTGGQSSNSLPGSVRSSLDFSRDDGSGLSNSVQARKLSDLLWESQYDLRNDYEPLQGMGVTWSQLDQFRLEETGPSQTHDQLDSLVSSSASYTYDVLMKAKLCCSKMGLMCGGERGGITLENITSRLSRLEASRMFHHVLVGVTTNVIRAVQLRPYDPILIYFQ